MSIPPLYSVTLFSCFHVPLIGDLKLDLFVFIHLKTVFIDTYYKKLEKHIKHKENKFPKHNLQIITVESVISFQYVKKIFYCR